jgi:hypothetical protein
METLEEKKRKFYLNQGYDTKTIDNVLGTRKEGTIIFPRADIHINPNERFASFRNNPRLVSPIRNGWDDYYTERTRRTLSSEGVEQQLTSGKQHLKEWQEELRPFKEEFNFWDSFLDGLFDHSTSAAVLRWLFDNPVEADVDGTLKDSDEYQLIDDQGSLERLAEGLGTIVGDLPFFWVGGALGSKAFRQVFKGAELYLNKKKQIDLGENLALLAASKAKSDKYKQATFVTSLHATKAATAGIVNEFTRTTFHNALRNGHVDNLQDWWELNTQEALKEGIKAGVGLGVGIGAPTYANVMGKGHLAQFAAMYIAFLTVPKMLENDFGGITDKRHMIDTALLTGVFKGIDAKAGISEKQTKKAFEEFMRESAQDPIGGFYPDRLQNALVQDKARLQELFNISTDTVFKKTKDDFTPEFKKFLSRRKKIKKIKKKDVSYTRPAILDTPRKVFIDDAYNFIQDVFENKIKIDKKSGITIEDIIADVRKLEAKKEITPSVEFAEFIKDVSPEYYAKYQKSVSTVRIDRKGAEVARGVIKPERTEPKSFEFESKVIDRILELKQAGKDIDLTIDIKWPVFMAHKKFDVLKDGKEFKPQVWERIEYLRDLPIDVLQKIRDKGKLPKKPLDLRDWMPGFTIALQREVKNLKDNNEIREIIGDESGVSIMIRKKKGDAMSKVSRIYIEGIKLPFGKNGRFWSEELIDAVTTAAFEMSLSGKKQSVVININNHLEFSALKESFSAYLNSKNFRKSPGSDEYVWKPRIEKQKELSPDVERSVLEHGSDNMPTPSANKQYYKMLQEKGISNLLDQYDPVKRAVDQVRAAGGFVGKEGANTVYEMMANGMGNMGKALVALNDGMIKWGEVGIEPRLALKKILEPIKTWAEDAQFQTYLKSLRKLEIIAKEVTPKRKAEWEAQRTAARNKLKELKKTKRAKEEPEILKPLKDKIAQLNANLRGAKAKVDPILGLTKAQAERNIRQLENDKFIKARKELEEYQQGLLDFITEAGLVDAATARLMKEANKNYIPLKRVFETNDTVLNKWGVKVVKTPSSLRRLEGSAREVINPIESIYQNTVVFISLAEKNRVLKAMIDMTQQNAEIRAHFPEISRVKAKKIHVSGEEIAKFFKVDKDQFKAQELEIYRMFMPDILGKTQVKIFVNGKAQLWEVGKDFAEALHGYDTALHANYAKIIGLPARGLRLGATTVPEFTIKNVIRDTIWASVFSMNNFIPGIHTITGFKSRLGYKKELEKSYDNIRKRGNAAFIDFRRSGADQAMLTSWDRDYFAPGMYDALMGRKLQNQQTDSIYTPGINKVKKGTWNPKGLANLARSMAEIAETATRLGDFNLTVKRLKQIRKRTKKEEQLTDLEIVERAGFEARRLTLDFARMGSKIKALNQISAFYNAGLQGKLKMFEELTTWGRGGEVLTKPMGAKYKSGEWELPIGKGRYAANLFMKKQYSKNLMRAFSYITLPSLILHWFNRDDPLYQQLPRWQKELFWIVINRDDDDPSDENAWILRIPKPFELGLLFGTAPEHIMDFMLEHDKTGTIENGFSEFFSEFGKTQIQSLIPIPNIVRPLTEGALNRNLFMDRPIIPRRHEGMLDEYMFESYTSRTARSLSRVGLGNPFSIDHWVQAWTGSWGRYAIAALDKGINLIDEDFNEKARWEGQQHAFGIDKLPFIKAFFIRNSPTLSMQPITDFWLIRERFQPFYKTLRRLSKTAAYNERAMDEMYELMEQADSEFLSLEGVISDTTEAINKVSAHIRLIHLRDDLDGYEKGQLIDDSMRNLLIYVEMAQDQIDFVYEGDIPKSAETWTRWTARKFREESDLQKAIRKGRKSYDNIRIRIDDRSIVTEKDGIVYNIKRPYAGFDEGQNEDPVEDFNNREEELLQESRQTDYLGE